MNPNLNGWEHTTNAQLSNLFGDKVENSFERYPKSLETFEICGIWWGQTSLFASEGMRFITFSAFIACENFPDSCCSALTGALSYPSAAAQADLKVLQFRASLLASSIHSYVSTILYM